MAPDDLTASPELHGGDVLGGKYALLEPLAVGGMGQVWSAQNLATGARVAAKVMLPAFAMSAAGVARFRREAQATATLSHRAIVRVFDLVELDPRRGALVMILELLRGHTLARHIEQVGRLSVDETLLIALPLLSALEHAHALGIVHRDLKPDNVFLAVEPDGQLMPKLVDFGISKQVREPPITLDGQTVGTPSYMSPEQTMGAPVDPRSDVFALGILIYECLSGRNPFVIPTVGATATHTPIPVFDIEPAPLDAIPEALWQVIHRALAKNAADRFASAGELARALRDAVPSGAAGSVSSPRSSTLPEMAAIVAPPVKTATRLSSLFATAAIFASVAVISAASARQMASYERPHAARHFKDVPAASAKQRVASVDRLDEEAAALRKQQERRRTAWFRARTLVRDPGF